MKLTKRVAASAGVAAAMSAVAVGALMVQADPALARSDCPSGYSCYYSDLNGANRVWIAPSCGWFDTRSMGLEGVIHRVANYGNGQVQFYDSLSSPFLWVNVGWENFSNEPPRYINIQC